MGARVVEQKNQIQQNAQTPTHLVAGRDHRNAFVVCAQFLGTRLAFHDGFEFFVSVVYSRDEQVIVHCALWELGIAPRQFETSFLP